MSDIIRYEHKYGDGKSATVYVQERLKGKHKEHCLCFQGCARFVPNTPFNCELAQANYEFCVKHDLVLPVWECPVFQPLESKDGVEGLA